MPAGPPTVGGPPMMTLQEQQMWQEALSGVTDDDSGATASYLVRGDAGGGFGGHGSGIAGSSGPERGQVGPKPRANKKRDQRSDLVEIWMTKNNALEDPKPDVKKRYAEVSHRG